MNKKNNKFLSIMIVGIIICFILIYVIAKNSVININSYNAIVDVDDSGNMTVTETWEIKYPSGYNVRFRDIPYSKNHASNPLLSGLNYKSDVASFDKNLVGVKVSYMDDDDIVDITDKVRIGYSFNNDKDEQGNYVECYPEQSLCESLFVDLSSIGGMKKNMIFEYTYTINGAVTAYNDIAELNWKLFSYHEAKIKEAKVQINIMNNNDLESLRVWGHGLSSGNLDITSVKQINITAFNVKTNEELEFRVLMNKNAVSNINSRNVISATMNQKIIDYEVELSNQTRLKSVVAKVINLLTVVMIALVGFIIYRVYKKYDKEYEPKFQGIYYRELPYEYSPAEMSYLYYFGQTNDEDVTATLLDLVRRGYLSLDVIPSENKNRKEDNMEISLNDCSNLPSLLPHESHIINWFIGKIGDGKKVTIEDIESFGKKSYSDAQSFEKMGLKFKQKVKEVGSKHDFFENASNKAKSKAQIYALIPIVFGLLCLIVPPMFYVTATFNVIVSIVALIVFEIYLCTIKKRSINGNEEFAKWKAFKKFLEEFSHMDDYPMPSVVVWEHYLVYATSLKIADKVMAQLKVKLPNISEDEGTFMSSRYNHSGFYYGYSLGRINSSISTARNNAISTIANHSSGGGSGHGGGFSGGSSFGGGGGGGRSR